MHFDSDLDHGPVKPERLQFAHTGDRSISGEMTNRSRHQYTSLRNRRLADETSRRAYLGIRRYGFPISEAASESIVRPETGVLSPTG